MADTLKQKYKVLDTSVIMESPETIFEAFPPKTADYETVCIVPVAVLQELDEHKSSRFYDKKASARSFYRMLEKIELEHEGENLHKGFNLEVNGRRIKVISELGLGDEYRKRVLINDETIKDLGTTDADRRLIQIAAYLKSQGKDAEIVTNDESLRQPALAAGLDANPWRDLQVIRHVKDAYKGWRTVELPPKCYAKLTKTTFLEQDELSDLIQDPKPNEYFVTTSNPREFDKLLRWDETQKRFVKLHYYLERTDRNVVARNPRQACLMDALRNPTITLTTAVGPAGTGKTFLALQAALELTYMIQESHEEEEKSGPKHHAVRDAMHKSGIVEPLERIILTRVKYEEEDEQLGFVPGSTEEKFDPYIQALRDNFIAAMKLHGSPREDALRMWDLRRSSEDIDILPFVYMRGRSLPNAIIISDEMQNGAQRKALTLCTRPDEGTRLIITGDLDQIDPPYLSPTNNALIAINQAHIMDPTAASIFFDEVDCNRSKRTATSLELLKRQMRSH